MALTLMKRQSEANEDTKANRVLPPRAAECSNERELSSALAQPAKLMTVNRLLGLFSVFLPLLMKRSAPIYKRVNFSN